MFLSCMVLASGEGRRFGANKLLAPFRGKPLITRTLEALPLDCFDEILVVTQYQEIAGIVRNYENIKFKHVFHSYEGTNEGIGSTIRKGMAALSPKSDGCLFCTADQPLRKESSFRRVVKQFHNAPERIVALSFHGEKGNPVLFPRSCYAALSSLKDNQSGGAVVRQNPQRLLLCEADEPWELYDVDEKQDLKRLEEILEREG